MGKKILLPFKQGVVTPPPVWLMRQAGRYLPEYRRVRKAFPSFVDFCLCPSAVCEVTLQPIQRFGFDGAILFSDILLLPALLGQNLTFKEKEGPFLSPLDLGDSHFGLDFQKLENGIQPVLTAIRLIRQSLPPKIALIGFAGAPWTVAAYMLEGKTSKNFEKAKIFAGKHPEAFDRLLTLLIKSTCFFLDHQVQAGAEILQLFESWAGVVPDLFFEKWVLQPTRKIVSFLKKKHPQTPLIGFPRGLGRQERRYVFETRVDGLSLDFSHPLKETLKEFLEDSLENVPPPPCVLQGNLDPSLLVAGGAVLRRATRFILETVQEKPFIFNLGHGILPETPLDHVSQLLEEVRSFSPRKEELPHEDGRCSF